MKILLTYPGKLNTVPMGRFVRDALIELGHEVVEFNAVPRWHEKLGSALSFSDGKYAGMNHRFRDVATRERPDLMLAIFGFDLSADTLDYLRQHNIACACWWLNDPFQYHRSLIQAEHYDYLFTNSMVSVADYRQDGIAHAYWLPTACAPSAHRPTVPSEEYRCDICFAGDWSGLRQQWCEKLAERFDIRVFGPWRRKLTPSSPLWDRVTDNFFTPDAMAAMFSSAKLVFNIHSWYGRWDHGTNPRLFEAAGCGACQVVDWKQDIPELFDVRDELATFHDMDDLFEKITTLLSDEQLRITLGKNARRKALAEHTYSLRMRQLIEIVQRGA